MRAALLLLILSTSGLFAQKGDSVAMNVVIQLKQMDSLRRMDSLRKIELLNEIERLKGERNRAQREALVNQLKEVQVKDSINKKNRLRQIVVMKEFSRGFPVVPFADTLFMVYTRVGSFTAEDRAASITRKIKLLYDDVTFVPDSLVLNLSESAPEIVFRDILVMSVNELEALRLSRSQLELAQEHLETMKRAIRNEREQNSYLNMAYRIGAVILILVGIYVIIRIINKVFRNFRRRIVSAKDKTVKALKINDYQLLDSKRVLQVALFFTNIGRLLIIILALYVALPLMFSVFPWTRGIADTLFSWILTPLKSAGLSVLTYLPNLFTILVIVMVIRYVIKFFHFIAGEIENGSLELPGFYRDWAKPTFNIVRFLIIAFGFIVVFPYLPGSDSPIFRGVSVFLGIIFSLGSSSAISNAVAGLVITYMRPFKIGDRIKIGELSGDVIHKSLLVTRIKTIKNENITIPNSTILTGYTVNYTTSASDHGLILYSTVTIGYDVPWKQVHDLLMAAAVATEGILTDGHQKPFVLQTSLDDFYVSYQINVYTVEPQNMSAIYSRLHQNIQDKFNEAGVEIMSPHYRAARDGSMTTVPASYHSKDYVAPPFNVSVKGLDTKPNS